MAHTNTDELKRIVLGSGEIYAVEFSGDVPEQSAIETKTNCIGYIQGGASVDYNPTFYTAKSDNGVASKTIVTEEEVVLKLGLITWNTKVLEKITATGRCEEKDGIRTFKLGGTQNLKSNKYLFRFVHKDPDDGDIRITILGSTQNGFSISFQKDKETVINPEIRAESLDDTGTLLIYEEEILSETSSASVLGS